MDLIKQLLDVFLHLDKHLMAIIAEYGVITYVLLFLVIFIETGLVIMPFLPGDSLLFAVGAFAAMDALNIYMLLGLLVTAAIIGDSLNYWIGRSLGSRAYSANWVNHQHLNSAQAFYQKYGGKTILLARFVPIIRTFAPFVAGIGHMAYGYFFLFNVVGAIAWVMICVFSGYFFGNIAVVKANFELVILGIIIVSLIPVAFEVVKARQSKIDQSL